MAADALEEKINKIRQQNEEIKRRHEEVEADKKNAARLNALVKMVPSTDWPERKEPPEFSDPPKKYQPKPKNLVKEHNEPNIQYRAGGSEGKKIYNFAQGEGPPPDPKYNFLADSEREEKFQSDRPREETGKNSGKNGKPTRNSFRKKRGGGDWQTKDSRFSPGFSLDSSHPDYDDWRAERNKIDEARINRQRTAEGNWRREWDNDKIHMADEISRKENSVTLSEIVRHDNGDGDKYHRGPPRNSYYSNSRDSDHDKRVINDLDDNTKVSHGTNAAKNSVTSVKVSSSNFAGTGRVGPRQRTRMMYSSHSERELMSHDTLNFKSSKSHDEKSNAINYSGSKNAHPHRRKDSEKSGFSQRREYDKHDTRVTDSQHSGRNISKNSQQKSPHVHSRESHSNYPSKSPKNNRKSLGTSNNHEVWPVIETFATSEKADNCPKFQLKKTESIVSEKINEMKVTLNSKDVQDKSLEIPENDSGDVKIIQDESHDGENDICDDSGYVETVLDDAVDSSLIEDDNQSLIIKHEDLLLEEKLKSAAVVSVITANENNVMEKLEIAASTMEENITEHLADGEEKLETSITDKSDEKLEIDEIEIKSSIIEKEENESINEKVTTPVHDEEELQIGKSEVEFLNTGVSNENLITETISNPVDIENEKSNVQTDEKKDDALIIDDSTEILENKEMQISSTEEDIVEENQQVEEKTTDVKEDVQNGEAKMKASVAQNVENEGELKEIDIVPNIIEKSSELDVDSSKSQILADDTRSGEEIKEIVSENIAPKSGSD